MQLSLDTLGRPFALIVSGVLLTALVSGLYLAAVRETVHVPEDGANPAHVAGPDLQLYRTIVARVHAGENYYDVAREELPRRGFPFGSTFNWRLPTYAYLLGAFPNPGLARTVLALLALMGVILAFVAEAREKAPGAGAGTLLLLMGVAPWPLAGDAFFAQEVWASVLLLLSVAAAGCAAGSPRWRVVSVAAGLLALFFRELVLPYCVIAAGLAFWHRRRWEGVAWLTGVALFVAFLYWHSQQVASRLTPEDRAASLGPLGWVQFGGLPFLLMATRVNAVVMLLPGWVVFLYLLLGVSGLLSWHSEQGARVMLTTLAYLAAFAIVGKPMNWNWGLMFAPLLPFGVVRAPAALVGLARAARGASPAAAAHP
jgi:hypothetical protein